MWSAKEYVTISKFESKNFLTIQVDKFQRKFCCSNRVSAKKIKFCTLSMYTSIFDNKKHNTPLHNDIKGLFFKEEKHQTCLASFCKRKYSDWEILQ